MKKMLIGLLIVIMIMSFTVMAYAHPRVPEQSIDKVNFNAADGLHRAYSNLKDGAIAKHVFETRFNPHD